MVQRLHTMQNTQVSSKTVTLLLFLCAIGLSSVAAFYAIVGLMTLFSGAKTEIAVMGTVLEISKLVITSWLYRNWNRTPFILKTYFLSAIMILMLLTSMGVFGFLSKAHMEQGALSEEVKAQVDLINEKINLEKEKIENARKSLAQLDRQVDELMRRTETSTNTNAVDRSVTVRRQQQPERNAINKQIQDSQVKINALNEEKAPKMTQYRKVEAEVGPIKYVASLIYGDSTDQNILEKSVKIVILLIVIVFDPLAVLMFIAFNQTMLINKQNKIAQREAQKEEYSSKEVPTFPKPEKDIEIVEEMKIDDNRVTQITDEIEDGSEEVSFHKSNRYKKKMSIDSTVSLKEKISIEKF